MPLQGTRYSVAYTVYLLYAQAADESCRGIRQCLCVEPCCFRKQYSDACQLARCLGCNCKLACVRVNLVFSFLFLHLKQMGKCVARMLHAGLMRRPLKTSLQPYRVVKFFAVLVATLLNRARRLAECRALVFIACAACAMSV